MQLPAGLKERLARPGKTILSGLLEGQDAMLLPAMVQEAGNRGFVYVCRDDAHLATLEEQLGYFAPELEALRFPAWDCLPYDRVSPSADILARRLATLATLSHGLKTPTLLLTTVNAVLQRVLPKVQMSKAAFLAKPGMSIPVEKLQVFLSDNGYSRVGTVVESGDFAVRGGLIDLFPPGADAPVRLDFFGDTLESIRSFDPQSQRSTHQLKELSLNPANEVLLTQSAIAGFRSAYSQAFGGLDLNDPLYESITNGRRYQGMEHWLPLFQPALVTLFDYVPEAVWCLSNEVPASMQARHEQVAEYYDARKEALSQQSFGAAPYKPLPPERLYLSAREWDQITADVTLLEQSPFEHPSALAVSFAGRQGRNFAAERSAGQGQVYDAVRQHTEDLRKAGTRTLIACWSEGSADRLSTILKDHDLAPLAVVKSWADALKMETAICGLIVLPLEQGFEAPGLAIISEQDVLGDRLVRRARKAKKAADFLSELASLSLGDLMVHVDHGIGRFEGLKTIEVQGAPHDCLLLTYADNARLFLPVENIELLSRYGSETEGVQLDRLGGGAWQAKKAKLKQRIREIAGDLIKTAAARELKPGDVLAPVEGAFDEFCARFPYEETEDQLTAIEAVLEDLQRGRPMDRLICGDVGFGKTEVALRAAFVAAYAGKQVAVVVPTTLLARQHFRTFTERFKGLPLRIAQASRLVPRKELEQTRKDLAEGNVDIVVGTHAILAESVKFRDLGLMIIDEEQHFGVKHKERLKQMRANVHVLTLSATPIPRTLQLALSGLREMSLITTPPLDRLAVRTYIAPFDPIIIREHLLREHFRGGQSFYVVPRISDLDEVSAFLREAVPEVKFRTAHGRMPPTELEDIMTGFYDRAFDVLLSTTIVESGLDISTANTMVIHRADMFGLAQLYQLRGRVGRSKQRAYALLTTAAKKQLTATAERRLKVLQSLDSLGAGFNLASHDLDIRGAGNLLGEEQHGNIREVGFELYQNMLEEAVAAMRSGADESMDEGQWSPSINIGTSVLIPESYVTDLQVRLGLYRRLADFAEQEDLDAFAAELHDRFGKKPDEVDHLLEIVSIKLLCRKANVEKVDAGPKGATVTFRKGIFANPSALVTWIAGQGTLAKLRPDMSLVLLREWVNAAQRLKGTRQLLQNLVKLAA
ncbi:transcription-repair coupling factor [Aestuariivirga litoralis]|uniref:transcription-repair coupling factor n=1 Tax=Aestuariivirga litoralis TaxID=2650924 RepID=UPI0018C610D6|nr:transcription-repair coupling factor [Aestuariivirga litoralis]MBG1231642.1 transcription-repair coupling factor [Aestuariivirga litoralis]